MRYLDPFILRIEDRLLAGIGVTDTVRGELRRAQLQRVLDISSALMLANIVNACIIAVMSLTEVVIGSLALWATAVCAVGFSGLVALRRMPTIPPGKQVSIGALRRLMLRCAFLAGVWGLLPLICLFHADGSLDPVTVAVISGMLGGGCIALSFVPIAAIAYVAVLTLFSMVALLQNVSPETIGLAALLAVYSAVLLHGGYTFARSFAQAVFREAEVREQASTIEVLLKEYEDGGRDWLWETDADGTLVRGGLEFAKAAGLDPAMFLSIANFCRIDGPMPEGFQACNCHELHDRFQAREPLQDVVFGFGMDGAGKRWFSVSGKPIYNDDGRFNGYRGVAKDYTAEREDKNRIQYLAEHDTMTGLYNRSTFLQRAQALLDVSDTQPRALFFLDINGFKRINDTCGHLVGDALLKKVAGRLRSVCKGGDVVARVAGDQFCLFVSIRDAGDTVRNCTDVILDAMAAEFDVDGNAIRINASIGIAVSPENGQTADALMKAADVALFHAKAKGAGVALRFMPDMQRELDDRVHMREELARAIERGELSLAFQPYFEIRNGALAGFEALARWNHPTLGNVRPAEFIPLAEQAGLIDAIGDWVLAEACRVAGLWPTHLRLSVNVSVPQFHKGNLVTTVKQALARSGLGPNRLELELTEAVFADDTDGILKQMAALKDLGVRISLDDFGTGYSSLMYLINFPFDKLKIDQSFVRMAESDKSAHDVLTAIADLGRRLDLETTIEGIETIEQLPLVRQLGCTFVQGYHFSRPLAEEDVASCIAKDAQRMIRTIDRDFTRNRKAAEGRGAS